MEGIWAVARARVRRRWLGLIGLGLLAGIVGGLSTAAVAGERRTVTVARRLIAATDAQDAVLSLNDLTGDRSAVSKQAARIERTIRAQPGVEAVWPVGSYIGRTAHSKDWYYPLAGDTSSGFYHRIVAKGRSVDPSKPDEVMVSEQTAANSHLRVGSTIHMDFYGWGQADDVADGVEERPDGARDVRLRVVGVIRDPFDIGAGTTNRFMVASPAFARRWGDRIVRDPGFAVRLRDGTAGIPRFVAGVTKRNPTLVQVHTNLDGIESNRSAEHVARLSIILLAVVLGLLGVFVVGQAVRRHLSLEGDEDATLEALGFTRPDRVVAASITAMVAAGASAVGVAVVSVAASPLFPLGRPRRLEPAPGMDVNVAVIAIGAAVTALVVCVAFALSSAISGSTRRSATRMPLAAVGGLAAIARPTLLFGTRLAVAPSSRRAGVGVRSAVLGAVVGITGAVAAVTFGASIHLLLGSSSHYGVRYHLSIESPTDALARAPRPPDASIPPQQGITDRSREIARDRRVDAVAIQGSARIAVDGRPAMAVSMAPVKGRVRPVVRSGRAPVGHDEIALGPKVARELDVSLGDRVTVGGDHRSRSMVVVGTVLDSTTTTPDHAEGALLPDRSLREVTGSARDPEGSDYYQVILVRFRNGADVPAATRALDRRYPYGIMDESYATPPPALLNIQDVQAIPLMLAVFFAGLVFVALGNGLVVAGRRHRRQFGIVRSLGFTAGQVRATMRALAATLAVAALAIGLPLGLGVGVWLWSVLSAQLDVGLWVGWPWVPIAVGAPAVLAVAAVAAAWPARAANAEPAAEILRTE
jgi:ABC-type lipoprotein release transport system permease subunit